MTPHSKPAVQDRTHTITVIDDAPNLLDQMLEQHEAKPRLVLDVATTPSKTAEVEKLVLDETQQPLTTWMRELQRSKTNAVKQVADAMADLRDIFPPSKWDAPVAATPKKTPEDSLETIFADKTRRLVVCWFCGDPNCMYSRYV